MTSPLWQRLLKVACVPVAVVVRDHVATLHAVEHDGDGAQQDLQRDDIVLVRRLNPSLLPGDTVVVQTPDGRRTQLGKILRRTDSWAGLVAAQDAHAIKPAHGKNVPLVLVVGKVTHVVWPLQRVRSVP